jgi:transposase
MDGFDFGAFLKALHGVQPVRVGVGVVVREMLRRMQFVETVNELLAWDEKQCKLSPGQRLLALVIAIVENRKALYRIHRFYAERDAELLLGEGVEAADLNDKALARALDKLSAADPKKAYASLCFRAVDAYQVVLDELHSDTTSVSVHGVYDNEADGLGITFGYSKDHRPDLRQFKVGLTLTKDAIPILGDVFDGNENDQQWNQEMLEWLSTWIAPEKRGETLLVCDSALVTKENLLRLSEHGYRFVSRLPNSFEQAELARVEAMHSPGKWQEVGKLARHPRKGTAEYSLLETDWDIEGRPYRLIVVHSTSLAKQKEGALAREVEKEQKAFEKAARRLRQQEFHCREDAEAALASFLAEGPRYWHVEAAVLEERITLRGRGRPRKGEEPEERVVFRCQVDLGAKREDVIAEELRWRSTFILISNDDRRSALELLQAYRGQYTVEASMRWMKAPFHISPIFLKKRHRVEAFGYVVLIAYLVYALIQRAVREALPEGEELQVEGRKTDSPTGEAIIDMLRHISVFRVRVPGHPLRRVLHAPDPDVLRILRLLDVPEDAFCLVPQTAPG